MAIIGQTTKGVVRRTGALVAVWVAFGLPAAADPLADIWLGLEAYRTGNYETAAQHFTDALDDRSLSYQHRLIASYDRALTRYQLGDYSGAIDDFDRALQLNPRHAKTFAGRGAAYAARGEFYRALQDYNRALKFDPSFALVYFYRANIHERLGDRDSARRDLEQAIDIDPSFAKAKEKMNQLGALTLP